MRVADIWRFIARLWKRTPQCTYVSPQAPVDPTPIDLDYELFLSRYEGVEARRFAKAFAAVWYRLPPEVRYHLDEHWRRLRTEYSERSPDGKWRLPIVGSYFDPTQVAIEKGALIGGLLHAQEGFLALDELLASSHLAFYDSDRRLDVAEDEPLSNAIAAVIAAYYWRVTNDEESAEFLCGPGEEGRDLAQIWGFGPDEL